jgi:anthranilate synthase component II
LTWPAAKPKRSAKDNSDAGRHADRQLRQFHLQPGALSGLARRAISGEVPLFGVCLGHQAVGDAFGGEVVRAPLPVHGKLSTITHRSEKIFRGINAPFRATRYHSLVVARDTLPDALHITAESEDGLVMAMSHRSHPTHSVQFHPESIASEHGHMILRNFLDLAEEWRQTRAGRA